jgi:hypothetical protein
MEQSDIELTARYATYERLIEYLLVEKLTRTNPDDWSSIKSAIIGPRATVSKGIIDVSDLEKVECHIHDRVEEIFGRASLWAAKALR